MTNQPIPQPSPDVGLEALKALVSERSLMRSLQAIHLEMGNIFQINLPGFKPVFLVGPESNRFVLASDRDKFLWRNGTDPVVKLLNRGLLVVDGAEHDEIRGRMNPAMHKRFLTLYSDNMRAVTDEIVRTWQVGHSVDMLVAMRKVALLILMDTLFGYDMRADLSRMWGPVLKSIKYISPGLWLIWPNTPRFGYRRKLDKLDKFLYRVIEEKMAEEDTGEGEDLISILKSDPGMSDSRVRDQFLTMLIAGHDTSTALLAWTLYLLGAHPDAMGRVIAEVKEVLQGAPPDISNINGLNYLNQVIKESLRLYPPIHIGARRAAEDIDFNGYQIPEGSRVVYSIYLTHRDPAHWEQPNDFIPERFDARPTPYSYVPFGGGPRNCIGSSFAQVEAKVILARLFQQVRYELPDPRIRMYMGATLEPRPGVNVRITELDLH